MKSLVTDIQRFSLNDGKGLRTTVFLKGCNMKCAWCHNPETISDKSQLMFYENKCIGCGKCFEACPTKSHKMIDGSHIIDKNTCVECGKCASICYAEALVMCGKEMSTEDVMKEVRQDKPYYENSNGGVTISGGEVLYNADFALEIAKKCKEENINVAIETNMFMNFDKIEKLLEYVDFVMCDIKIFDNELHKKYTGVCNELILENIRKLDESGKPYIVRTPLIPNVTDTEENIEQIACFVSKLENMERYELLNFNPLGEAKYRGLGVENAFEKERPKSCESLKKLESILQRHCLKYKIA